MLLALIAAALAAAPVAAKPADAGGSLHARPGPATLSLGAGDTTLRNGSIVYRPDGIPGGPRPLLVILHGYTQDQRQFLRGFEPWARRCGVILVAPVAQKITWDIIATAQELDARLTRPSRPSRRFGADVPRIDADLAELFAKTPVDPQRISVLGFSDGASYALSLGLANPDLFSWIISLSPGFALWPDEVALKQKVFIAHGTEDSRLDFANTRDRIVKPLREAGMEVQFRRFAGDHVMVRPIVQESLRLAFGC